MTIAIKNYGCALLVCVAMLDGAGSVFSQQPVAAAKSLQEADRLINEGKFDEALAILRPLARETAEPAGVETRLGRIDYEERRFDAAIGHLKLALHQDREDGQAAQLLGLSYYMVGDSRLALPLLKKAVFRIPNPLPTGLDVLGDAYLKAREYDKARAVFARLYGVPPESAQAHLVLGQMMLRQDLATEAIPELRQAVALNPRLPMAHFLLGESYLDHSQVGAALREFQEELRLNPIQWLAYWRIGDADFRLGKWTEAEEALERALWINPNFTGPYVLLGKVELRKGDPGLAARFLKHAIEMDPNNSSAHYLLGKAYQMLGKTAAAEREFTQIRSLHAKRDRQ